MLKYNVKLMTCSDVVKTTVKLSMKVVKKMKEKIVLV